MAVYRRLLLSAGGGIVSAQQQADQARDTATVLIGLGGTGVDCLRTIKTQVYARLKADDPEAIEPTYQHIRFLGVDADDNSQNKGTGPNADDSTSSESKKSDSLLPLDPTEFFSIANPNVIQALGNKQALAIRDELKWLRHEDIPAPNLTDAGAGGVRQVGRFMMMDRSAAFMARVQQEINAAKEGLQRPQVFVHIFTGLSGGTGAGCFLDVCYMVRSVAQQLGGGITTLGYFFLPDVNLAKIPMSRDTVRQYVPINGYASMQELDYCMNLQYNGGAFEQEYQGHNRVKWDRPPVDIAHLICATDANANVIQNAYEYAMNVTAEYVMDFLTYDTSGFGLSSQLANFQQEVNIADSRKLIGANLSYCALGASCASLPLRQVNTYLASELFSRFAAIGGNVPSRSDVDALSRSALCQAGFESAYDSLWQELQEGAGDSYALYDDDWRFALKYGDRDLIEHYTKQTAAKNGVVERNAKNLMGGSNQGSLLSRMAAALAGVVRDIDRGPVFAHGLLDASRDYSLLNVVDGLIAQNASNWQQEGAQTQRLKDCEDAQSDFRLRRRRFLTDSDKRRFADFEHYLRLLEEHKYLLGVYEQLDGVLRAFRRQVEDAASGYYLRLARVTRNLIETFAENRDALASARVLNDGDGFSEPLMTVAELKRPMDAEIARINVPGMLDAFMGLLLDNPDAWLEEDEGKICRLVTDFFVRTAFGDFAGRSITAFLKDKYNTTTDEELANRIYQDWMVRLTAKAAPLFYFDHGVMSASPEPGSLACLSVPMASAPIKAAAQRMQATNSKWQVKDSALTDRIYVMGSTAALPLAGYNNNRLYERRAYSSKDAGRHYYETPGLKGMSFSDWRGLAPLTPAQFVDLEAAPDAVRAIVERGMHLFDCGYEVGLIDDNNYIHQFDPAYLEDLKTRIAEAKAAIDTLETPQQVPAAQQALDALAKLGKPATVPTRLHMQNDGHSEHDEDHRLVARDHFVASPALQLRVESSLAELDGLRKQAESVGKELEAKIKNIGIEIVTVEQYRNALFTGVISIEGNTIVYHRVEFGITTDIVLSKTDTAGSVYPYGNISVYQGFLSFQKLDAELRREIAEEADNRLNSGSPTVIEVGEKLKTLLSDARINAWAQLASGYSERAEIIRFLGEFKKAFDTHCLIYLM